MFAPPDKPTTPLTFRVRWSRKDRPLTSQRSTPQCHSNAASAEKTITSGNIWKAMITGASAPSRKAKGKGPPPR